MKQNNEPKDQPVTTEVRGQEKQPLTIKPKKFTFMALIPHKTVVKVKLKPDFV